MIKKLESLNFSISLFIGYNMCIHETRKTNEIFRFSTLPFPRLSEDYMTETFEQWGLMGDP